MYPKLIIGWEYQSNLVDAPYLSDIPLRTISRSEVVILRDSYIPDRLNKLSRTEGMQKASIISQALDNGYEYGRIPSQRDYRNVEIVLKESLTSLSVQYVEGFTEATKVALAETIKSSFSKSEYLQILLTDNIEWLVLSNISPNSK